MVQNERVRAGGIQNDSVMLRRGLEPRAERRDFSGDLFGFSWNPLWRRGEGEELIGVGEDREVAFPVVMDQCGRPTVLL